MLLVRPWIGVVVGGAVEHTGCFLVDHGDAFEGHSLAGGPAVAAAGTVAHNRVTLVVHGNSLSRVGGLRLGDRGVRLDRVRMAAVYYSTGSFACMPFKTAFHSLKNCSFFGRKTHDYYGSQI